MSRPSPQALTAALLLTAACCASLAAEPVTGFLRWRGPTQDGSLPHAAGPERAVLAGDQANLRWTVDLPGRGTPVIARYPDGDRLFALGYTGEGAELLEVIVCLDPATGREKWRRGYADFLSDVIYNRYSIGAPSVDPETGHVYFITSPGLVVALDKDGRELWQVSMMDAYGRLTFPNGRTGTVAIDGDLAIVNAITSNWGAEGPARNRFYAFDKLTGELVWSSDPGVGPPFLKDSSFSTPVFETRRGVRLFYAGSGDGNLVAVNARNGRPLWRYQMAIGGVNCSPVIWPGPDGARGTADDLVIQTHGKENVHDTGRGYMLAVNADAALAAALNAGESPVQLGDEHVAWRNDDVSMFTSSPTLVGDTVHQCTIDGHLVAVDAADGRTRWKKKVAGDQLHASPLHGGGAVYIPFWNDGLHIFPAEAGDAEPTALSHAALAGQCIGSPALYAGRLYVHTTEKLYCFGAEADASPVAAAGQVEPDVGAATQLRITPAEFLLRPGQAQRFAIAAVDARGYVVTDDVEGAAVRKWVPPTARVRAELSGELREGRFQAAVDGQPSAGALRFEADGLAGTARGRVLKTPPFREDFDGFELTETDAGDGVAFAYPPLPWIGARLKWQVRDLDGERVLAKTLDNVLFQRSMVFMGHPDDADYTITADVRTDGGRRLMSVVGVINQRYLIALDGNKQAIEVSSNHERVKEQAPLAIQPDTWYRLKTRVDVAADGSGVVRAKAWPRGGDEPAQWMLEARVPHAHTHGSPGLFGFSPQSRFRVYIDNVEVTPNE